MNQPNSVFHCVHSSCGLWEERIGDPHGFIRSLSFVARPTTPHLLLSSVHAISLSSHINSLNMQTLTQALLLKSRRVLHEILNAQF